MKTIFYRKNVIYKASAVLTVIFTLFFGQAIFSTAGKYISDKFLTIIITDGAPILCQESKIHFSLSGLLLGFDISDPSSIIKNLPVMAEYSENNDKPEKETEKKNVTLPNVKEKSDAKKNPAAYNTADGIILKNSTDYSINKDDLINESLGFTINTKDPSVLVMHTHTSEAYLPVNVADYEQSDIHRTQNPSHNVVRVGEEFVKALKSEGIVAIHDTTVHDYPSYNGSYINAEKTIKSQLSQHPSIKMVIDIHRDAVESNGTVYKYSTEIEDKKVAQVMVLTGSDANGIPNPNWHENLKFSLKYQRRMNLLYPGLTRPLSLVRERYNTHLTTGSIILEVGTTGNTLEEAINAAWFSGKALGNMLKYIVK